MRKLYVSLLVAISLLATGAATLSQSSHVEALSGNDFDPGRIIDDTIFFNSTLLGGPADVQRFLNSKVPACDTQGTQPYGGTTRAAYGTSRGYPPPYICLRDYWQDTPSRGADSYCGTYNGGYKSATQIIFDVGQACGINPGVLIVLLQKEQSLITDTWPWSIQYQKATGFGCPDTASCDSQYYGFFNQVYNAARQFRKYQMLPQYFNYRAGRHNYIMYHPSASCGPPNNGQNEVFIQNSATAALYNYTPYRPNQAALSNLYGTGDGCSSYGNRNFWRLFNEWFGSTSTSARVIITRYDTASDKTGEAVRIGFSLNQQPTASVTIPVHLTDNNAAGFVSPAQVVISPERWNRPDLNQIVLYGKNSSSSGAHYYQLITDDPGTADGQFRLLRGEFVEDVTLTNFDNSSQAVYRLYSNATGFHVYTANPTERDDLVGQGYTSEGIAFYYCKSGEQIVSRVLRSNKPFLAPDGSSEIDAAQQSGFQLDVPLFTVSQGATVPVYRLYNAQNKNHFYTTSAGERDFVANSYGYTTEGVAFQTCDQGKEPVYRMYNHENNDHFYTTSPAERDIAGGTGYRFEGVGFYLDRTQTTPVALHRLVHNVRGTHFYTTDTSERDAATALGYRLEGTGFFIDESSPTMDVYRLYHPAKGGHLYTISAAEKDAAISSGFKYEGVGFLLK